MAEAVNTHGLVMEVGRHKGERVTRVPVSYLKWMVQSGHSMAPIAKAELERRGTQTPELDVSGHAIDRASLSCCRTWHETRRDDEGIHAWLCRVAREARDAGRVDETGKYHYLGLKFAFEEGAWPVLKTVMPTPSAEKKEKSNG